MHQFEHMQMKYLAEGGVEQNANQDLIHRQFEVTNLNSGIFYSTGKGEPYYT